MGSTRLSLLTRARSGSGQAWSQLVELYQPLICGWLVRYGARVHDAEELTQDVLSVLVEEIPKFQHSGRVGAFRAWLRQITVYRLKGFWRAGRMRPVSGTSDIRDMLEQLADDQSELSQAWDLEHQQHVLRHLLLSIEAEFEPVTFRAFRMQVFDDVRAEQVSAELRISVGAAYSAKSRVMRRLREEAADLLDESL